MAMGIASSGSSRRGRARRRAAMADINVTPLVDVMLVLLIIFMVTAPLLTSGVPIDLPDSRANPLDQTPDQVTMSIDRDGFIFVDDSRVPAGQLPAVLGRFGCETADAPLITLRADRALDYGRVMAVMGELNRAGCRSISLVTNGSAEAP
ncbi:protein TolR [Altererythrobacter salegens]|uniref:Protein TolR n=1 Tax=Croceibacterium salegens TaxID=1737568 RepID=A0A6I4SQW0_9SPHN|nr:ExbD/TolR family protein [Croceibacterium salegens]MXO58195.1 protein TolR [Croceibacterium salegens]